MPGTKHRTQRRPIRRPPTRESKNRAAPSVRSPVTRTATAPVVFSAATSTVTATPTRVPAAAPTASKRKLSKSPNASFCSSDSDDGSESECEGKGMRLLEVAGLNASLQEVCCCKHVGLDLLSLKRSWRVGKVYVLIPTFSVRVVATHAPLPFPWLVRVKR